MEMCIIHNRKSGSADEFDAVRRRLGNDRRVVLCEVETADEVTRAAAKAAETGFTTVVAAGGDGTINLVVNGLAADFRRVRLGVLPLGTANDLCRTLGIPAEIDAAIDLLRSGTARPLDVYRATTPTQSRYGINVAAGGFTGQVHEVLSDDLKATWGPLAYVRSAASVLPDLTAYHTTVRFDDGPAEEVAVFNLMIANGRAAGGGLLVGPQADPGDGLLDVAIVQYGPLFDLAAVAARFLAGTYLESDQVLFRRARRVAVASEPGMWFSIDGDLLSNEPMKFEVLPGVLATIGDWDADEA